MSSIDNFVTHHTGLSCCYFKSDEEHIRIDFMNWLTDLREYDVILLSPWLIPVIVMLSSINFFVKFIHQCAYLLVVDECHMVLDSNHPLSILFGPNGPVIRTVVTEEEEVGRMQDIYNYDIPTVAKVRILCFTSALLPRDITDPKKAQSRLEILERRTNCRLETASELLTMLALGARPKEQVIFCPKSSSNCTVPFHKFMMGIFQEIKEFIYNIESSLPLAKHSSLSSSSSSSMDNSTCMVTNAGGFRICVLDYCKRAINQCEEILSELGLWCAAQIVRVFAKHLIALDRQRTELFKSCKSSMNNNNNKEKSSSSSPSAASSLSKDEDKNKDYSLTIPKINDVENRISYLLRHTVTQMCFLSRLFQMEFDSILTLKEFQSMVSPKVLHLIEQLKLYKPNMNFRIEVAELPTAKNSSLSSIITNTSINKNHRTCSNGGKGGGRRRRNRSQASKTSHSSISSMGIISCDMDSLSDSMSDTMSSLSDDDDDDDNDIRSVRSFSSAKSRLSSKGRKRKNKSNCSANLPNLKDLHFVPASTLNNGGIKPDVDPSTLVYRAVLDTDHRHKSKNNSKFIGKEPIEGGNDEGGGGTVGSTSSCRLCGLILVPCQFSAYALSRLIDELCIWDVDLYFIKIGHLFCRQTLLKDDNDDITVTTALKKAKQYASNFNSYKTSVKFGNEPVNNENSSTNSRNPFSVNQEETITNFRRGAINLLVATQAAISAVTTTGTELPRCNLVIALRLPNSLAEYLSSKARSRLVDYGAKVIYLMDSIDQENRLDSEKQSVIEKTVHTSDDCNYGSEYSSHANDPFLGKFQQLEQLLIQRCRGYGVFSNEHDVEPTVADKILPPILPRGPNGPKFYLSKAINVINQYCARLPSDYITNLAPKWTRSTCGSQKDLQPNGTYNLYQCVLRLPINSSIKATIVSEAMVCKKLAKFSAALNAIQLLYITGEMDSKWELTNHRKYNINHDDNLHSPMKYQLSVSSSINNESIADGESDYGELASSYCESADEDMNSSMQNSVRRRQYYYRKFPMQMSNCLPQPGEPSPNYLYYIDMRLVNPLPGQQQNQHDRPCHYPEDEPISFGLLTTKPIHHVPAFPIFSRSGEEKVGFIELWSPKSKYQPCDQYLPIQSPSLTEEQIDQLIKFHRVLFQEVLRFEKDSVLEFNFAKAYLQVLIVPARRDTCSIDWDFVNLVLTSFCEKSVGRLLPRRLVEISPQKLKEQTDQIKLQAGVGSGCSTASCKSPFNHHNRGRATGNLTSLMTANTMNRLQKSKHIESQLINKSGSFEFREEDFINAVVTPGYRNLDQPQYYYVAAIRYDMNPLSPFPSESYRNFAAYYINKYNVLITTPNQPLLDVNLTVLRLNLLIPRYINIHGFHLLTSSNSGNDGDSSVWRKAVCIPSILYRLEHLLLAEELRHRIAFCQSFLSPQFVKTSNSIYDISWKNFDDDNDGALFESLNFLLPVVEPVIVDGQLTNEGDDTLYENHKNERKTLKTNRRGSSSGGSAVRGRGGRRKQNYRNVNMKKKRPTSSDKIKSTMNVKDDQSDVEKLTETMNTTELLASKENETNCTSSYTNSPKQDVLNISSDDGIGNDDDGDVEDDASADSSSEKPAVLKLHAASASLVNNNHLTHISSASTYSQFSLLNANLESLLQETKVIELNSNDVNEVNNDEEDDFRVVENYVNIDKEYLETGSDTESVDSFEGNVRFFPPEDDDDDDAVDNLCEINVSKKPTSGDSSIHFYKRAFRPGPATVLQALTMSCSNDFINLERMETIGDSFLKFVVTVYLYLTYPNAHEGKLSHLRSRIVCNSNLYRLGKAKDLHSRMVGGKFEPHENWVPPGYYVRQDKRLNNEVARKPTSSRDLIIWSTDTLMDDEVLRDIKVIDENKIQPIENFTISEWDPNDPKVIRAQHVHNHCLIAIQQAIPINRLQIVLKP
ncbi:unnamed protein product [Heterobilharzia americana]|nr:unnamed protein product [Heterobilharzia americana]